MLKPFLSMCLRAVIVPAFAFASLGVAAPEKAQALPAHVIAEYGVPPAMPTGALTTDIKQAVKIAFVEAMTDSTWGRDQEIALMEVGSSGDPRLAWLISDLMRFISSRGINVQLADAASELMGREIPIDNAWGELTDLLIAWDVPAPPDYLKVKRAIFTSVLPEWKPLFVKGEIDWRHVSWGGVPIDARPFGQTDARCNCIPAADNPEVSNAAEATWLKDSDVIFGVVVNGEARAYPRRIMEVREMVNDTLGGRDLGIPYCTLCGAAQAYFTDGVPSWVERPVLRTSGLLIRSNKVMFDLETYSVFDTFLGKAVTGPLLKEGIMLEQASVVTTDWGTWKKAHPETTVLVEALALGRDFDFRNGRDANGPIFPVGDVDPRLGVHEDVIGVITASGKPVAFQRSTAFTALSQGREIVVENVHLKMDAGGIKAVDKDGQDLGSHQAFWFAWSQFHPGTALWEG
ncbi:MAG: DUF3179 domain-containing (seleno)protein [Pseudomonadota bacterium]